jgi:hypothetical protein
MGHVQDDFPGAGLVYPKGVEKLPFMTWKEIERRIGDTGLTLESLVLQAFPSRKSTKMLSREVGCELRKLLCA